MTWPLAQAVLSADGRFVIALPFALAFALGFAFVGMLVGKVLERVCRATTGREVRVPAVIVIAVAFGAVLLGMWFGGHPRAGDRSGSFGCMEAMPKVACGILSADAIMDAEPFLAEISRRLDAVGLEAICAVLDIWSGP